MIKMRLNSQFFNLMKDGHKIIEARINDEKRQLLNIGDEIEFTNRKTEQTLNVKVVDLLYHPDFGSLINNCDIFDFGSNNKGQLLYSLDEYYSNEDVKKYGVLGIKIQVI